MFVVAAWDSCRRIGLLARDRMGKNPLYYWQQGDTLFRVGIESDSGHSRVRAPTESGGAPPLSQLHVPHPLTIFEGVRILLPAHQLVYRPGLTPAVSRRR